MECFWELEENKCLEVLNRLPTHSWKNQTLTKEKSGLIRKRKTLQVLLMFLIFLTKHLDQEKKHPIHHNLNILIISVIHPILPSISFSKTCIRSNKFSYRRGVFCIPFFSTPLSRRGSIKKKNWPLYWPSNWQYNATLFLSNAKLLKTICRLETLLKCCKIVNFVKKQCFGTSKHVDKKEGFTM